MPPSPVVLRADNFTPPTRTPWGGTRLLQRYKAGCTLAPEQAGYPRVGESWEISVEPDFPSRAAETDRSLADVIAADAAAWLGAEAAAKRRSTALLVKLLDAAEPLSVQIHPADDHPGLGAAESGKPESWYVLEASEEAALYIGLRQGVDRDVMREALQSEHDVSELLCRVPVEQGDFFVIGAGTPHAIGAGITLVEPQRVLPGRRGVTYRYWDWNRRYDAEGQPDPEGQPRRLDVEAALEVTGWDAPREQMLLERIRRRAGTADVEGGPRHEALGGPEGPVRFDSLRVERLSGTGTMRFPQAPVLRGVTVVAGAVRLKGDGIDVRVERGRSAVIPAACHELELDLDRAHAVVSMAD